MKNALARTIILSFACAAAATAAARLLHAQAQEGAPFRIERLDAALDPIISPSATLETLGDRFALTEGPVWVGDGSNGAVYFTDTVWGLRGAGNDPARELPYSGFFLIKDGKVTLLGGDKDTPGTFPNGITLSPDERFLYVTAWADGRCVTTSCPMTRSRTAVCSSRARVGWHARRLEGNLYTTKRLLRPQVIQITSPEGKPLGRLHLPQPASEPRVRICATNVAFGDADNRGLLHHGRALTSSRFGSTSPAYAREGASGDAVARHPYPYRKGRLTSLEWSNDAQS